VPIGAQYFFYQFCGVDIMEQILRGEAESKMIGWVNKVIEKIQRSKFLTGCLILIALQFFYFVVLFIMTWIKLK